MKRANQLEQTIADLQEQLRKGDKIRRALMNRVERSIASTGTAYTLFENNILLNHQVDQRTEQLKELNRELKTEIAKRRRIEEELRAATAAADRANKQKSEFLANTSHEIRTPMNGVIGMTDLLLRTPLTSEQIDYTQAIKASAEALMIVVNEILDLSKIEAHRVELEHIPFSLRNTLGDLIIPLALQGGEKGVEVIHQVCADVPDKVIGDPWRLRQILINLLGNAIKFTDAGEVFVRCRCESLADNRALMRFSVVDTGIGIAEAKLQTIFEAFSQADSSTGRRYGGTGLGLTISAQLVELMGGKIEVESDPGVGCAVHVTVPLDIQQNPPQLWPKEQLAALHAVPVLVVDDSSTVREILREQLECWGMLPVLAEGADQALSELAAATARAAPYPLVVSDVEMPRTDGFALATQIRDRADIERPKIIFLASAGKRCDTRTCRSLAIAACITKPVQPGGLLDAVSRALGPNAPRRDDHRTRPPADANSACGLHILLAEDNKINQVIATRMLERQGHTVTTAMDGQRAVCDVLAPGARFDAVLMDIQMPVLDGLEATRQIRQAEVGTTKRVPIIAMTAHAMDAHRIACLEAGMDAYVTKPLRETELNAAIQGAIPPTRPVP